jgi:predicted ATP-grasp superfamily ATP-dependent carboligase
VPVPAGVRIKAADGLPTDFSYPAVLKPDDGAGALEMVWVRDAADDAARAILERCHPERHFRLETYHPGQAASVALLCGPRQRLVLPPAEQHLAEDGSFHYLGGRVPLQAPGAPRAQRLAEQVAGTLANPVGYMGIDLVLGADLSGADDRVIEINPRLTTSYLGLRRLARGNLAAWLGAIAQGDLAEPVFDDKPVDFQPTVAHPSLQQEMQAPD